MTEKEDIYTKKKTKNLDDKSIKIILVPFTVGASEGVRDLMILTRRVAALPVTIVLYHDTCVIFLFF